MRRSLAVFLMIAVMSAAVAQRPGNANPTGPHPAGAPGQRGAAARSEGPKPYKEVITYKAVSNTGLFTVHKVEEKCYFEIPDSIFGRDILVSTRYSRTSAGGNYGGEQVNLQTIQWQRGPSHTVLMRVVTTVSVATDSSQPIAQAVRNSNLNPIAASFDVR